MHKIYWLCLIGCLLLSSGCQYSRTDRIEDRIGEGDYIVICNRNVGLGHISETIQNHRCVCLNAGFSDDINSHTTTLKGFYCTVFTTAKSPQGSTQQKKNGSFGKIECLKLQRDAANALLEIYTNKTDNTESDWTL